MFVAVVAGTIVGGCAGTSDDAVMTTPTAADVDVDGDAGLAGVTAEVVLTRQRDLVDRGFVNVMTANATQHDLLVVERRLTGPGLDAPPVTGRRIKIAAGRTIAVQVPYGNAVRCSDTAPQPAALTISYLDAGAGAGDTATREATIPLAGTDILDGIRAEQCATAALATAADVSFTDTTVAAGPNGDELRAVMHVDLTDPSRTLTIGAAHGTILVAARRTDSDPVTVDRDHPHAAVPITFVVNRCDPHALAEVTKKYGVDVDLTIDDAPPVAVGVAVDALVADLDAIVAACRARGDQ